MSKDDTLIFSLMHYAELNEILKLLTKKIMNNKTHKYRYTNVLYFFCMMRIFLINNLKCTKSKEF